jgi:hypothetical protein
VPRTTAPAYSLFSSSLSSLIFAFLPKCPACLVLLLAPLGIKVPGSKWFLAYAILMVAGIPLAFFLTPACRRCGYRPLILAMTGLAIMTIGRIETESLTLTILGAAVMFAAAFWMARKSSVVAASGHAMTCATK